MKDKRIAVLTIGQSPRVDVMPDIEAILGDEIQIIEYGILDPYEEEEAIEALKPKEGESILVSRLASGRGILMSEEKVHLLVQESISMIENMGIQKLLLLCTGEFPDYEYNGLLMKPYDIVHNIVKSLAGDKKVGIIVPDEKQKNKAYENWGKTKVDIVPKSASPYIGDFTDLINVSDEFKEEEVSFIVLDCMGYSSEMKKIVQERSEKPVILSRTIIARVIKELFL